MAPLQSQYLEGGEDVGRKRTREAKPIDRIGERVDLEKCPVCTEHMDCFSYLGGRCTALKYADEGCAFYCSSHKAISEVKQAYQKLKESGRTDLIRKYIKTMAALGVLDDEIEEYGRKAAELDAYKNVDFDALMRETPDCLD